VDRGKAKLLHTVHLSTCPSLYTLSTFFTHLSTEGGLGGLGKCVTACPPWVESWISFTPGGGTNTFGGLGKCVKAGLGGSGVQAGKKCVVHQRGSQRVHTLHLVHLLSPSLYTLSTFFTHLSTEGGLGGLGKCVTAFLYPPLSSFLQTFPPNPPKVFYSLCPAKLEHLIHLWFTPTGYERWTASISSAYPCPVVPAVQLSTFGGLAGLAGKTFGW
jgi:hypothetical protein